MPIATATIQDLANRVEAAARVVAEVEVNDATQAGANPGSVSKANATLA